MNIFNSQNLFDAKNVAQKGIFQADLNAKY